MACEQSVLESITVIDINNDTVTLNGGNALFVSTNNIADEVLKISVSGTDKLNINLLPIGVVTTAQAPYGILYDGATAFWNKLVSEDSGNKIVVGTDGGLFLSIAAATIPTLFQISSGLAHNTIAFEEGPYDVELSDRIHFYSDPSINFTAGVQSGILGLEGKVVLSENAGNQITLEADGLFVPVPTNVSTGFTNPTTGIYTYTNEILETYDLNFNASALPAIDTNDILSGGPGELTDLQTLLDTLSVLVGVVPLTSLGYVQALNKLIYTDTAGTTTEINLSNGASTSLVGTNSATMETKVTGLGTILNPYTIEAILKAGFNDLKNVSISAYTVGKYVGWTGSNFDLLDLPANPASSDSYIREVKFDSGSNSLIFTQGGSGDAYSGSVSLASLIPSGSDSHVALVELIGSTLHFTGVGLGFNSTVSLVSLLGGAYTWGIRDKANIGGVVQDTDLVKFTSTQNVLDIATVSSVNGWDVTLKLLGIGASDDSPLLWDAVAEEPYWGPPTGETLKENFSITEFTRSLPVEVLANGRVFFIVPTSISGKTITNYKVTVPDPPIGQDIIGDLRINGISIDSFTLTDGSITKNVTGLSVVIADDDLIDVVLTQIGTTSPGAGMNVIVTVE